MICDPTVSPTFKLLAALLLERIVLEDRSRALE